MQEKHPKDALSDDIIEQASAWFVRMNANNLDKNTKIDFNNWLDQDDRHKKAYDQTLALWDELALPAQVSAKSGWHRRAKKKRSSLVFKLIPITASLGVIVAGTALWFDSGLIERHFAQYSASIGKFQDVKLADGSHLYLDSDSAVNTYLTDQKREIDLLRGRAWFDVSQDKNRPFIVRSNHAEVKVIGTAFSVEKRADDVEVIVARGRVMVKNNNNDQAILEANNEAIISNKHIDKTDNIDLDMALSWRQGLIIVNEKPLREVVEKIARYSKSKIVIADQSLGDLPVTGVFLTHDKQAILKSFETVLGLKVYNVSDILIFISK